MNCIDIQTDLFLKSVYSEGKTLAESRWNAFDVNAEMVKPGMAGCITAALPTAAIVKCKRLG